MNFGKPVKQESHPYGVETPGRLNDKSEPTQIKTQRVVNKSLDSHRFKQSYERDRVEESLEQIRQYNTQLNQQVR